MFLIELLCLYLITSNFVIKSLIQKTSENKLRA